MNNTGLQIILIFALSFMAFGFIIIFVSMSVHWKDYKYYKITYRAIKTCSYVMVRNSHDQQTYHKPNETNPYTDDEIIFFLSRQGDVDDIKLLTPRGMNNYIHAKGGIDLYARFWFKMILRARAKYNHALHYPRRSVTFTEETTHANNIKQQFKFLA